MNPHLQRGILLYEQSRYDQAESEFQQAILTDPQDAHTRAMLALTLSQQERHSDAEHVAKEALKLDPTHPFTHYALAVVLTNRADYPRAIHAIMEAISLDPDDADFRALHSQILMNLRKWKEALAAAEEGLALDAEHIACTNLRAMALVNLGRKEEAGQTIDAALARNPQDSTTHANQGWTLLHAGKHEKALEHFRESLRLDPENEWARQGIVEALKAKYFIYSLMLKYFLWMSRLSSQMQWVVILLGFFGMRILRGLARSNPGIAPYIFPIQVVYLIFVFLTWMAEPLFNLLLRLNKFGRMALSRREIVASNWVGGFTGLALLCLLGGLLGISFLWLGALVFGFSTLPLSAIFRCPEGWPRKTMIAYTIIVVGAGISLFVVPFAAGAGLVTRETMKEVIGGLFSFFALGIILSGFVANYLIMQRVRK